SKLGGPAWIAVSSDGTLSGVPPLEAVGRSSLIVRAAAAGGAVATATLPIIVEGGEPVVRYAFDRSFASTTGDADGVFSGIRLAFPDGHRGDAINLDGSGDYITLPAGIASGDDI